VKFFLQDIRYGLRLLRKNLSFTIATVTVLALSICATVTIFSVVNAVILRPLPYKNQERLVGMWGVQPKMDKAPISPADFLDWAAQSQSFDGMAAYSGQSLNLTTDNVPERVEGALVSPNFFSVLEMSPLVGRAFTSDDEKRGANRMVVLGEGFWERRFGRDPRAIGTTLTLNNEKFEVVGVMPRNFQFPERTDVWLSPRRAVPEPPVVVDVDAATLRSVRYLGAVGRLKPGVTAEQADGEVKAIASRLAQQYPETNEGNSVRLIPLHEQLVGDIRPSLYALLGAVLFVLLISCSNVANLLIARALARSKEISVRIALGASRARITQQLLTEGVLLSLIAGALGLILAHWALKALLVLSPFNFPLLSQVTLDARVLTVTILISLLTGVGFGLVPVIQSLKADIAGSLKEGKTGSTSGPRRHRLRSVFVVAQITLSFALLTCAGLMLKSFYRLQNVNLGFNPDNILTMQISLPRTLYTDPTRVIAFYDQTLQQIKTLPGVKDVGAISKLPLSGPGVSGDFLIKGRTNAPGEQLLADRRMVSPDYFHVMSIPLASGRFFSEQDVSHPGLVLISQTAAKRFWPNEQAVGQYISVDPNGEKWLEIVGVVGDVKPSQLTAEPKPEIYFPYFQNPWHNMTIVAKLDPAALNAGTSFRSAVSSVDKGQPVYNIKTMGQIVDELLAPPRFNVVLLSLFAASALLLTVVGLYGLMASYVMQRTNEIGIRMALGAQPKDIIRMILAQGMRLIVVGLATGVFLAYALSKTLSSLLFTVSTVDLATYAVVSALFLLVMLVASLIPARRASRLNPLIAIRQE
jgi:putative ABC transport system permease protein